jgi:uncharacterized BrkB/YihY/UPF0761 family membrane protein
MAMIPLASRARTWIQKTVFTAERFDQHELANHAAAGAYAFPLSATPAVLLAMGLASALIGSHPRALASVKEVVLGFLGPLASEATVGAIFSSGLGPLAIVVGACSLIWAPASLSSPSRGGSA